MSPEDVMRSMETALNVAPHLITSDTKASDIQEWDSMGQLAIIFMLDREYDVKLEPNEAASLDSVEAVLAILRQKGKLP